VNVNPALELRTIRLRVRDLDRSAAFYSRLGFVTLAREAGSATFATAADAPASLTLVAAPQAGAAPRDAAGLFHAALLLPSRAALGSWLRQAAEAGVEFQGFSDHGVSEAIYFADPEGNGLEFYADRPQAAWPVHDGRIAMSTLPLDLPGLLAAAGPGTPAGGRLAGARWGHLHLRVTGLERSAAFYREHLGVVTTQADYPGAHFLAADGYHHHLGLNTWGKPRRPQPADAPGLLEAVFARRSATAETTLHDPDGIAVRLVPL